MSCTVVAGWTKYNVGCCCTGVPLNTIGLGCGAVGTKPSGVYTGMVSALSARVIIGNVFILALPTSPVCKLVVIGRASQRIFQYFFGVQ